MSNYLFQFFLSTKARYSKILGNDNKTISFDFILKTNFTAADLILIQNLTTNHTEI